MTKKVYAKIRHEKASNYGFGLIHIEIEPGCIINIRYGLTDVEGRQVISVETLPDNYAGDTQFELVDQPYHSFRIREKQEDADQTDS